VGVSTAQGRQTLEDVRRTLAAIKRFAPILVEEMASSLVLADRGFIERPAALELR
jgi:hypothetical protein